MLIEQCLEIGVIKDRLNVIEEVITSKLQKYTSEIVRLDGRYHRLNQENKAIRTALSLHYKEHNPEAYMKPTKINKPAKPNVIRFNNTALLFNDMKDTYQSFTTSKAINANGGSPMIESTMIFRMVDLNENGLRFQMTRYNPTTMEVHNITKADKIVLDSHGVAEYRIYFEGGTQPIVFQAVPKRL